MTTVTVPATTANIGPGFDCLGAALSLYNRFHFSQLDAAARFEIQVRGLAAERVSTESDNLAYQAFLKLFRHIDQGPPPIRLEIDLAVPLARGLGSSSTAIVGGLLGANAIAGFPLDRSEIIALAIAIEGHPDNVVPALLGRCCLAATGSSDRWVICDVPWHDSIKVVVAVPDFELSTATARQVLPNSYTKADAIFNAAHLGLLLRGLETGEPDWLAAALSDRIHQPYRKVLIPGYDALHQAAIAAGAYGLVISGAGPTLLTLTADSAAEPVAQAMTQTWKKSGIAAVAHILAVDANGAQINH
ncbi:MAG: homoserine kinase [Leptolyngbyaceae cyanobacterium RM1_1_2]|nr:homoserine kinase [Leptolyngbyaceae cyanobacterium RM1_1_2]